MTRAVKVGDTVAIVMRRFHKGQPTTVFLRNKGVVTRVIYTNHLWPMAKVQWEDKQLAYILTGDSNWVYIRYLRVINAD